MKITLISGAGSGIGLSIAEEFYKNGHSLVLLVKNKTQKTKLTKIFNIKRTRIFSGDLSNYNYTKKLSSKVKFVHNIINNAATRNDDHFLRVKRKDLDHIIDLNFKSVFFLTQIFTEKMIKNRIKGSVINLSSQLGHVGAYNRTAYCSSKFAVEGFTKSVAMVLSKYGIKINSIAPTKTIVNKDEILKTKKRLNLIKNKIPLKQFTQKEDIAKICYFLTTDACKNITGTSIKIDGGWTAGK